MPAHINHNTHLNQVHRNLSMHYAGAARQVEQLASGERVNRSSDDPASLALADSLQFEVRAVTEGARNVQQTVQMLQVAEGALSKISDMMRRMQELATQSASSTYNDYDRFGINAEFQQLKQSVDHLADSTTYNRISLLNEETVFVIQAGPSPDDNDVTSIEIGDMRVSGPTLNIESLDIGNAPAARQTIERMQAALDALSAERNRIAAYQNRLQHNATTAASVLERLQTAEADVREADVARSITELTKSQIMAQTAASVAMDANTDIERILSLLR